MDRVSGRQILNQSLIVLVFGLTACTADRAELDAAVAALKQGDFEAAYQTFYRLARNGDAKGQFYLAQMYREGKGLNQDYAKAFRWYRQAAEQGLDKAQHNLALMYHNGLGVPKDLQKAAKWYREAAEQGYVESQQNLALLYYHGHGVSKDME
ncbi:MAG: tetratricopeptide repeat protein, partial [Gammaproteobacteria bacterium]